MNNIDYIEEEINLKNIMFNVLYNMKKLILLGIVFSILLGGYKGIKSYYNPKMTKEQYDVAIKQYEAEKSSIESQINVLNTKIDIQKRYIDNSIYMKIDSNKFTRISASYLFTPADEMASVSNVMNYLTQYLYAVINQVAGDSNIPVLYIKEIISLKEDSANYLYKIDVIHNEEQVAFELFNKIEENLFIFCRSILVKSMDFSVKRSEFTNSVVSDSAIMENQNSNRTTLEQTNKELAEKTALLNELVYPTNNTKERVDSIATLKWMMFGFMLGLITEAIWQTIKFSYKDVVYDEEDIRNKINIPILGTFANKEKFDKIESILRKIEGRPQENKNETFEYLKENVSYYRTNSNRLLITGSVPAKRMEKYQKAISEINGVTIETTGNILDDPLAVSKLIKTEGVIFVVEAGITTTANLRNQIKKSEEFGKKIVGIIVEE